MIGIVASVIGLILKKNAPEFALLLTISAALAILCFALDIFSELKGFFAEVAESAAISSALLTPVMKSTLTSKMRARETNSSMCMWEIPRSYSE
jgi:stage III sporulation protein AD